MTLAAALPALAAPEVLTTWGFFGSDVGEFDRPLGIAVDSSNNVYVADQMNFRIQKFTPSGNPIRGGWGIRRCGSREGEFGSVECSHQGGPRGIAVSSSGAVYVADTINHRIQQFDTEGQFVRMWGWGVGGGSSFQVCTSSCRAGLAGSGQGQFQYPEGIAVDVSGNVYVADSLNQRIQKFYPNGGFLSAISLVSNPYAVAVDSSLNVYVAETGYHRIKKFSPGGTLPRSWGGSEGDADGQFKSPSGIDVDAAGNMYVADTGNNRVQKFNSAGAFALKLGGPGHGSDRTHFNGPTGVVTDSTGNIYIADTNNNRIVKYGERPPPPTTQRPPGRQPPPGGQGGPPAGGPSSGGGAKSGPAAASGDKTPPKLKLGAPARQPILREGAVLVNMECDESCTLTASAEVGVAKKKRGGKKKGKKADAVTVAQTLAANKPTDLKIKLAPKDLAAAKRALLRKGKATITVLATAKDSAGNSSSAGLIINLK